MPGFPSTPPVADFSTYANGALPAPWSGHPTTDYTADMTVSGGLAGGVAGTGGSDLYQDQQRAQDSEVWVTVATPTAGSDYWAYLRMDKAPSGNGYVVGVFAGSPVGTAALLRMYRCNAGNRAGQLIGAGFSLPSFGNNWSFGMQAVGNQMTCFYQQPGGAWTFGYSAGDTTYPQGGFLGLGSDTTSFSIFGGGPIANPYVPHRMPLGV